MSESNKGLQQGLSLDVGAELSRNIVIHKNVDQEIIITTSDKVELVLIKTKDIFTSQRDWWTPFGLFISFITTLCTADFKEWLSLKKEVWQAIFIILTVASSLWLIHSFMKLYKYWGKDDLKKIIAEIKLDSKSDNK